MRRAKIPTITEFGDVYELTKLVAHAPSALIGDARLALDFLGRHAMTSTRHEVHREKPDRQLRAGFVKYCISARIDVMTALLARKSAAFVHHVEACFHAARWTKDFCPAVVDFHQLRETRPVIGVLSLEFFECVFGHESPLALRLWDTMTELVLVVKG
jgi:hypothetical protein